MASAPMATERQATYTVAEVAARGRWSEKWLRKVLADGSFPVKPLPLNGRLIRFPAAAIDRFLAGE